MNILYVSQFFYPERAAAAIRAYENAKIWTSLGHSVTLFTGYPNFPTGRIFEDYKVKLLEKEEIEGIKVIRNKVIAKPNTTKILRAVSYFSFTFFSLWNIFFNKKHIKSNYDVVLGTSGTVFAPIPAYLYAKLNKIPFVLELRDITYKQLLATGSSKKSISYKLIRFLELSLCKRARAIVTLTEGFRRELLEEGIEEQKIHVIPNGFNLEKESQDKTNSQELVISYFGTFGYSQDLTRVINILNGVHVRDRKIKLIFIGDGAERDKLLNYKNKEGISNLEFLSSMPQNDLEKFYEISDFCVVALKNNKMFRNTIPSKLFEIMGRRKPLIFFGPEGEASLIIRKSKAGISLTSEDDIQNRELLGRLLNELVDSGCLECQKKEYGGNGYNYVRENYNRQTLAEKYLQILKSIMGKI